MITTIATFTMRKGKVPGALKLIRAVKKEAEAKQPGTLVYMVHRVIGKNKKPGRELYFYERYRDGNAVKAHINSASWMAVTANWQEHFEGELPKALKFFGVDRIGAFSRRGAIPAAK